MPTPSLVPEASPSPEAVEATPTSEPVSQENVLYQDDFSNPATGWTEEKFDNYFIGYHEPEYYHVEITGPNYKTTVFEPEKRSFDDATIEMKVFTVSAKTAPDGDFNYGAAFRPRAINIMPSPFLRAPRNGLCSRVLQMNWWF